MGMLGLILQSVFCLFEYSMDFLTYFMLANDVFKKSTLATGKFGM